MEIRDFSRYHFRGQREGEKILRIIHRHWFNIVAHYALIALLGFILIVTLSILTTIFPGLITSDQTTFLVFLQNLFLIFLWLYGYLIWIDYYFDVWIITNERIVNIEQKGLFVRQVSELKFSRIQDVTSEVVGLIPTLLNFGDVKVQTAAEEDFFLFRQIPDPYFVKDLIMERLRTDRDEELNRMVCAYPLRRSPQSPAQSVPVSQQ